MVTLTSLVERFATIPDAPETIEQASVRARDFVEAAFVAGHGPPVDEALRSTKLVASDVITDLETAAKAFDAALGVAPAADEEGLIAEAEARFGAALPESLRELWRFLAEPARARFVRGVVKHTIVAPRLLVAPPAWVEGARLCCITDRDSVGDTRERFGADYEEWLEASDPSTKISSPSDLGNDRLNEIVMLDPALKESIISLAYWHDEDWFIVHDLRTRTATAPVFSNHDDDDGYSKYVARDVRGWFSWEIREAIKGCADEP